MANAAGIEQFEQFYLSDLPGGTERTIQCMHDVPPADRRVPAALLQTAGSILGLGHDVAYMRAAMGHSLEHVPTVASRLAGTLSLVGITSYLHGRGCGGEKAMPDVRYWVAGKDPGQLVEAIACFGLNLSEDTVEQAHHTYVQSVHDQPLSPVPGQELAAAYIENGPPRIERIDVDGDHLAGHILVDLTGKPFDTRAAWDDGRPAYNIGFGAMPGVAFEGVENDPGFFDGELLLAVSAIRHAATAEMALRHPIPGQELAVLVHE